MSATLSVSEALAIVEARERFGVRLGLDRMRRLLDELDHPERAYAAVHVVGTNGKSTAVRTIEAVLQANGVRTGAYLSPHVVSLAERFRVGGSELELGAVISAVLPAVRAVDAVGPEPVTQFELLTAAAFQAFAAAGVDVAVVEAGLGGRHDATNVLDARVVVLTTVALDHEEQLGDERSAIADEKLAVVTSGATVVLGEAEWEAKARARGAASVVHADSPGELASAAAEAQLGYPVNRDATPRVMLPGRCEVVADEPREVWDGAHNPHAVGWLVGELGGADHVLVLSILEDKDVEQMLAAFARIGSILVTTTSSNTRALPAGELMKIAHNLTCFNHVEAVANPIAARSRGLELARDRGAALLISGSLYLLHDLVAVRPRRVP